MILFRNNSLSQQISNERLSEIFQELLITPHSTLDEDSTLRITDFTK
jgi:hypothetical protein